jgi:hypothetical protein
MNALPPEVGDAAARGWRIHPLRSRSKAAILKDWQHKSTSDLGQIEAWAREYPGCNWGAVAGPESGFFAVDVDDPAAMQRLENEYGPIPEGLCVVTSRGYALIYEWPKDAEIHPATKHPCEGIDIRGQGSYIVIPPSVHPSGHVYRYSDDSLPIPACPSWLLALTLNRSRAGTRARQSAPAAGTVENEPIGKGQRTPILSSLIGKLIGQGVSADGIKAAASALNQTFSPPHPEEKIERMVADMVRRYPADESPESGGLNLLRGIDISEIDVPWILENHIPDQTVFGIHGRPGDGKTRIALRIAADLSHGKMPFTGLPCPPRNVLILSNEDAPGRIRGLYKGMGGELDRLLVENTDDAWWLGDLERLNRAVELHAIGFLAVDSLASHSGKTDLNAHADTTRLLVPLRALAEHHSCAVAVVHHLNKLITADHIAKVAGSIGITASFRHNLHVVPDPEDAALRLLVNGKSNLAPPDVPSLRFALFPCEWRGKSTLTIEEAYSVKADSEERPGRAESWLREALADGEWHDAGKLQQQAASGFNVSRRSIFRAADRLSIERRKDGFGGRASWRVPKSASMDSSPPVGTLGTHGDSNDLQADEMSCVPCVPLTVKQASPWHSWDGECGGLLQ